MKNSPFDKKTKKPPSKKPSPKKAYQKAMNFEAAFNNAVITKEPLQEVGTDFFFIDLEPF
jgi:hypothetical protein